MHELHRELGNVSHHVRGDISDGDVRRRGMVRHSRRLRLLFAGLSLMRALGRLRHDGSWRKLHHILFEFPFGRIVLHGLSGLYL
ncbi:MAG: hypothetical protein HZA81_03465 [Candidatus Taylorbacteria bacterium]|nr:hypothetical protein [Candidatus Taylorbacteria bacterium]